jgi:hypothetical protein
MLARRQMEREVVLKLLFVYGRQSRSDVASYWTNYVLCKLGRLSRIEIGAPGQIRTGGFFALQANALDRSATGACLVVEVGLEPTINTV